MAKKAFGVEISYTQLSQVVITVQAETKGDARYQALLEINENAPKLAKTGTQVIINDVWEIPTEWGKE